MQKKIGRGNAKWFAEEIPELLEQNVIDAPTAQRLTAYYENRLAGAPAKVSYFLLALVIVGALLVSGGVILLFAYNWDMLPKWARVAVAFLPLLIGAACGVWTILGDRDARWREFSAFFTAAGFAVLIALISQIYHTGGTLEDYLRLVMALALPLVYIFRSQSLALAYSLGLFAFFDMPAAWHLPYVLAILPFYGWYLFRKPYDGKTVCARYGVLIPVVNMMILYGEDEFLMLSIATVAMFFTAGLVYRDEGQKGLKNPWLTFGWLLFTILLSIGSATRYFWRELGYSYEGMYGLGLWVLPFAVGVFLAVRRWTPVKLMVMAFPLVALLSHWSVVDSYTMFWFTNVYFAVFAATMLFQGIKRQSLMEINGGMLQLALLFTFRFFDSRISIIGRAVAFILIGLAFIAMNVWLGRRFKKAAPVKSTESEAAVDAE